MSSTLASLRAKDTSLTTPASFQLPLANRALLTLMATRAHYSTAVTPSSNWRTSLTTSGCATLNGELPNAAAKTEFVDTIKNHTMVNEQLRSFFKVSALILTTWRSCVA